MLIWVELEVTAVAKAFKWKKSYGVENLDDSGLNRFVLSSNLVWGRFLGVGRV